MPKTRLWKRCLSKFNGDDRIDVYFATLPVSNNVCSTEKPAKRSTHVCDSEGLWGEYVFDKQLGCTNKTQVVDMFV